MDITNDNFTLVGNPPREVDSQKWEISPLGAGHSIRNVKTGKYLSVKSISREALIVASDFPASWHIKEVHVTEESAAFYEIRWPLTDFMFELSDLGSSSPKTKIHLTDGQLPSDKQRCRYWKPNRSRQDSFYRPPPPENESTGFTFTGMAGKWKTLLSTKTQE
ncbi:carbohydrate-binding module family 13 protein [Hydnomerulius pinastri MD-312]|nr:carbohydrate-binding module family 13 protein [Hydnomerulius pinastri MD-312]